MMTDVETTTRLLPPSRASVLIDIQDLLEQAKSRLDGIDMMADGLTDDGAADAFHLALDAVSDRLGMIDEDLNVLAGLPAAWFEA
jgi:hypothetical protein